MPKTYAVSVGLRLEKFGGRLLGQSHHSQCAQPVFERDIESRLNRYSRDEDITNVWIWAEERSDGSYDLYIGYT